jgi:hypothetical protein
MPATYEPIATSTLGSTSTLVTFSSIPATYTDIFAACQIKRTSGNLFIQITVNNDATSLYSFTRLSAYSNSAVGSDRQTGQANWQPYYNTAAFINFASFNAHFMNYANTTTFKSVLFSNAEAGQTTTFTAERTLTSGLYRSTNAINRIDFTAGGNSFAIGSTFTLYGIKAA